MATAPAHNAAPAGATAAATLPYAWYSDRGVLEAEQREIFARSWQYVGPACDLASAGDTVVTTVADVPVVVVRGKDGTLRGFLNVCRHRGHPVAAASGRCSSLQCPYHGWTYGLDGSLKGAPRSDREPAFDKSTLGLVPVGVDVLGPMVFVNLDASAAGLTEWLGPIPEWVRSTGIDLDALEWDGSQEYEFSANWKLFTENSLECYHCPTIHPTLNKFMHVGPDDFWIEPEGRVIQMGMPYREAPAVDGVHPASKEPATYPFVFPNIQFFTFRDDENDATAFNIQTWVPRGPDTTYLRNDAFYTRATSREFRDEYGGFQRDVVVEDIPVVEAVHRTVRSGALGGGRLLLDSERGIAHFAGLVREHLTVSEDPR